MAIGGAWMPDDQRNAVGLGRQLPERAVARREKIFAQKQVFRRIAAQCQLRRYHQIRAREAGALRKIRDARDVSRQIADGGIHLGNRNFHIANISSWQPRSLADSQPKTSRRRRWTT